MGPGQAAMTRPAVRSDSWAGPAPRISVVVSTFRRPHYLPGLIDALEDQELAAADWEAIIVDNGSGDETWPTLVEAVAVSSLRVSAVRVEDNRGPGGGRNVGAREVRSPVLAFTDDDCLPTRSWLGALLGAFGPGVSLVQGRVRPEPEGWATAGPWDHTVDVGALTPWAETSNVAYRAAAFASAGGFDESDTVTGQGGGGRAFGEDGLLAWRVTRLGGERRFSAEAVVHHRVVPATFVTTLKGWRNCRRFPALARRSGLVAESLWADVFLNRDTARFDLAVGAMLLAVVTRRPVALVGTVPWLRRRWPTVRQHRATLVGCGVLVGQRAVLEGVRLVSLIEGSIRYRRLVL